MLRPLLVALFLLAACSGLPPQYDGGQDAGQDAGQHEPDAGGQDAGPLRDGGELVDQGSCYGTQRQRFIARWGSFSDYTCMELLFKTWDGGGFSPLFPDTLVSPAGFALYDARAWPCALGGIEQSDGGLHPAAWPLDELRGEFTFYGYALGRPWGYFVDGGVVRVRDTTYRVSTLGFGLNEYCKGD